MLLAGLLGLAGPALCAPLLTQAARLADLDAFVHDFTDNYAYLDRAEKPWLHWIERYRSRGAGRAHPASLCRAHRGGTR